MKDEMDWLYVFHSYHFSIHLEWKRFVRQKTMVSGWVDVRSGASDYGYYWLYVEMDRSVNVIILRRNGETIFDYLFHVFPVCMGIKGYRCAALHDFSRGHRGA